MCRYNILISIVILFTCAIVISAQSSVHSVPRCFHFTWLGPQYNNESVYLNATCQDATKLSNGIPCALPLVASYDGTWPNVSYIWEHYTLEASCILDSSDVCATYTYYFDGHVLNSTYMCTRAVDTQGMVINNGCYQQTNGSFATKVCFCRSIAGGLPCNNATFSSIISISTVIAVIAVTLANFPSLDLKFFN